MKEWNISKWLQYAIKHYHNSHKIENEKEKEKKKKENYTQNIYVNGNMCVYWFAGY